MITEEWTIGEIIRKFPSAEEVLKSFGLNCLGCPSANGETLLAAAVSHGLQIDSLLAQLNKICGQE